MATLIFDNTLSGHHLEYLNHIYKGAIQRTDENLCLQFQDKNGIMSEKNVNGHKPTIFAG